VDATNRAYEEAMGSPDLGRPSRLPLSLAEIDRSIEAGHARLGRELLFHPSYGADRGPAKGIVVSGLMSRLGLSGFYFPWTGEANYNALVPACSLPHTIAHEKAHQRGIAREDEAHFLGFLACLSSGLPYVRYSGDLFAENELLGQLRREDPRSFRELLEKRDPGVVRDLVEEARFWERYEGAASELSRGVNNAYLKAQGVKEGVESYSRSVRLLVLFGRTKGGRFPD
jgi:hypothetical protein